MRAGRYLIALIFLLVAWAALDTWLTRGIGTWETVFLAGLCSLWLAVAVIPWLPIPHKATLMSASLSVLFALYAFEAYMRLDWALGTGPVSKKLITVASMRNQGIAAYPDYSPWSMVAEPLTVNGRQLVGLSGISSVTTVLCNEGRAEYMTFKSDPYGFRNPSDVWKRKINVALIGDSFVMGSCVNDDKNFAHILRLKFPGTLNLGYAGIGPLVELGVIREYLHAFKPSTIFWFYYEGNDVMRRGSRKLSDLDRERNNPVLMRYLDPGFSQNLIAGNDSIDRSKRAHVDKLYYEQLAKLSGNIEGGERWKTIGLTVFRFLTLVRTFRTFSFSIQYDPFTKTMFSKYADAADVVLSYRARLMPLFHRILEQAKKEIEDWGGELIFIYLPYGEFIRDGETHPLKADVVDVVKSLGLDYIDFTTIFAQHPRPATLFGMPDFKGHYSVAGNALIGEHLIKKLESPGKKD